MNSSQLFKAIHEAGKSYFTIVQTTRVSCSYEFCPRITLSGFCTSSRSLALICSRSYSVRPGAAFYLKTLRFLGSCKSRVREFFMKRMAWYWSCLHSGLEVWPWLEEMMKRSASWNSGLGSQ